MKEPKTARRSTIQASIVANRLMKTSLPVVDNALRDATLQTLESLNGKEREDFKAQIDTIRALHTTSNGISRPEYRGQMRKLIKQQGGETSGY